MRRTAKLTANMLLLLFLMVLMVLPVGTAGFMRVEEKGIVLSSMNIRAPETKEKPEKDINMMETMETTESVEAEELDYTVGTN